eukprot:m.233210 g.233210  ORF g.233210 m.233210 type:complete len:462 (+) comp12478_c0_seq1:28-1413(+)
MVRRAFSTVVYQAVTWFGLSISRMLEVQVVIMAGGQNSRMYPLTNERLGKAMLPVCNAPMISYVLHTLVRARVDEAFICASAEAIKEITIFLQDFSLPIRIDFEILRDSEGGTADAIRQLGDRLTAPNILVVACDLLTTLPLHRLLDLHRLQDATVTCLFASPAKVESDTPTDKRARKEETGDEDYVGLAAGTSRLVLLASQADYMDEESLDLPLGLLRRHPDIRIHTDLLDAHCYVLNRLALDILKEKTNFISIRSELIPHLVRRQHRRHAFEPSFFHKHPVRQQSVASFSTDLPAPSLSCHALVLPPGEGTLCMRVSTVPRYGDAHRLVPKYLKRLMSPTEDDVDVPLVAEDVKSATQIGQDSMVGPRSTIGESTSLKRSVVGKQCVIGDKCKITNSVIMDFVTIGSGSTITNCVIAQNAHVQAQCSLVNCQVAMSHTVLEKTNAKSEVVAPDNDYLKM